VQGAPSLAGLAPPAAPSSPSVERRRLQRPMPGRLLPHIARGVSHMVVWIVVFVPVVSELARGWRPYSDDAAIASRAYESLSLHPPLVGMITSAYVGVNHVLFDPGPLLFYLLAVPVHLDPSHGLFWGSALVAGAVLSLSIEAAWSAGQWLAAAAVAFAALDLLWLTPAVFENLPWNAYFPLPFFMAAVLLAWVVALGKVGWWPVLVFVATVAAQSHLLFVIPAIALTFVALVLGLVVDRRPRHLRWIGIGIGAGLVCWLPPLIQELGGHGNLSALAHAGSGRTTVGFAHSLQLVGDAGGLHPLWLTHLPSGFRPFLALMEGHAAWFGGLILAVLLVITMAAVVTGGRRLGALGAIALALAASLLVAFAVFPVTNIFSLGYLVVCLWLLSILIWSVVVWAVVAASAWAWRSWRVRHPAIDGMNVAGGKPVFGPLAGTALTVAALALVLSVAALGVQSAIARPMNGFWNPQRVARDNRAAEAIERIVPRGPVAIEVGPVSYNFYVMSGSAEGMAYRLQTDGWQPGLVAFPASAASGLAIPKHAHWPRVRVTLTGPQGFSVARIS
jgi:hypothetical protein